MKFFSFFMPFLFFSCTQGTQIPKTSGGGIVKTITVDYVTFESEKTDKQLDSILKIDSLLLINRLFDDRKIDIISKQDFFSGEDIELDSTIAIILRDDNINFRQKNNFRTIQSICTTLNKDMRYVLESFSFFQFNNTKFLLMHISPYSVNITSERIGVLFEISSENIRNIELPDSFVRKSVLRFGDYNNDQLLDYLAIKKYGTKLRFFTLKNNSFIENENYYILFHYTKVGDKVYCVHDEVSWFGKNQGFFR